MSMFDRKKAVFKKKELDLNEMVENIANSFSLRVEHTGGKVYTDIEAIDSGLYVDEVHFQNVIFNLMDNAVKYRKPDQPLNITMKTWNDEEHLYLSITDTGLGMKKENLKIRGLRRTVQLSGGLHRAGVPRLFPGQRPDLQRPRPRLQGRAVAGGQ